MPNNVTNGIFTDYCYEKMWDLFKNHDHEIGSEYLGDKRGKTDTDCIIYCKNVLSYAHEKIGRPDIAEKIRRIPKPQGTELARYLTRPPLQWKAHYWNPDVRNSRDGDSEHPTSYRDMVKAQKIYYEIPLSGVIINYNLIYKRDKTVWVSTPTLNPNIPNLPLPVATTSDDLAIYERVSKVKFAFGIARGGTHTFMLSYGEVFEVHWGKQTQPDCMVKNLSETSGLIPAQSLSRRIQISLLVNWNRGKYENLIYRRYFSLRIELLHNTRA